MSHAWVNPTAELDEAEADAIEALEARLASAEAKRDEEGVRRLRDELSDARMKRVKRITNENWDTLERLVGHPLRRR